MTYRHGLRVGEACALTWDQIDFDLGDLHVSRLKGGKPSVHPIVGDELRALRRLRREYPEGRFVFQTELKGPMTPPGRAPAYCADRGGERAAVAGAPAYVAARLRLQTGQRRA